VGVVSVFARHNAEQSSDYGKSLRVGSDVCSRAARIVTRIFTLILASAMTARHERGSTALSCASTQSVRVFFELVREHQSMGAPGRAGRQRLSGLTTDEQGGAFLARSAQMTPSQRWCIPCTGQAVSGQHTQSPLAPNPKGSDQSSAGMALAASHPYNPTKRNAPGFKQLGGRPSRWTGDSLPG
jgi:hypothetical protein